MNHAVRTTLASALALGCLAAPAMAADDDLEIPMPKRPSDDLKIPLPPKNGLWELTLKGTQVTTWTQKHEPQSPCDATVNGDGSQTVSYSTRKPIRLKLVEPKGGRPVLTIPSDTLAENGFAGMNVALGVMATREGSQQTISSPGGACNGTGAWDGTRPAKDCDESRWGRMDLSLGWAAHGINKPPRRGHIQVAGHYRSFLDGEIPMPGPTKPADGKPLANTFQDCPYWATGPASPSTDELVLATTKLPVGKLKRMKDGKTVKASGAKRMTYAEGDFSGDTLNTWNLKIKRIF